MSVLRPSTMTWPCATICRAAQIVRATPKPRRWQTVRLEDFVLNQADTLKKLEDDYGTDAREEVFKALEEDIRVQVRKFLAPYEYPKEIEFIDALPMTTTGKVQRKVLREREAARLLELCLLAGGQFHGDHRVDAGDDVVLAVPDEAVQQPGAIFATNTSTIPITQIAAEAKHPENVVGMHFFSPANVMRLVEVVRGAATAKPVLASAMALASLSRSAPPDGAKRSVRSYPT